jgi:hypothetical protein
MKRIASILTGPSLSVLFLVASAHAQYDEQRMTANIPFEFTVGNVLLPAGQYDFLRTEPTCFRFAVQTVAACSPLPPLRSN